MEIGRVARSISPRLNLASSAREQTVQPAIIGVLKSVASGMDSTAVKKSEKGFAPRSLAKEEDEMN